MDEEIIQRIVYIVLAIVFFFALSKKKKTVQKQEQIPQKNINDHQRQQTKSTKTATQESYFPPVESTSTKNTTFTPMKSSLESEIENLETIEDEIESDHRIIKKKIVLDEEKEQNNESFKVSQDDLRKAVILSDIIRPKYF